MQVVHSQGFTIPHVAIAIATATAIAIDIAIANAIAFALLLLLLLLMGCLLQASAGGASVLNAAINSPLAQIAYEQLPKDLLEKAIPQK